jgi:hypothetical protein
MVSNLSSPSGWLWSTGSVAARYRTLCDRTEKYWTKIIFCSSLYCRSRKLRLMTVTDPLRWPRGTPLSTKVGTKFRRQVAVAQLIMFACGLSATEFVFVIFVIKPLYINTGHLDICLFVLVHFEPLFGQSSGTTKNISAEKRTTDAWGW